MEPLGTDTLISVSSQSFPGASQGMFPYTSVVENVPVRGPPCHLNGALAETEPVWSAAAAVPARAAKVARQTASSVMWRRSLIES